MIIKQFKVYPDGGWVFIEVLIHHSQPALVKATGQKCWGLSRGGYSVFISKTGKERLTGRIGEIHLCRCAMGAGTVSHEATHHAFRYFDFRKRFKMAEFSRKSGVDVSPHEEAFCWIVGSITNQIYRHWWAKKKRQLKPQFLCGFKPIPKRDQFPDGKGMK